MCELFGVSSRLPTRVGDTLERLMRRGGLEGPHGDGWGVAFYEGPDVFLLREPRPAAHSRLAHYLEEHGPASRCMIAHIRRATHGETALRNTQPFIRELGGRVQTFAHNGELKGIEAQPAFAPKHFQPLGNTDSEIAFCALLDRLHGLWKQRSPPSLRARLAIITRFAQALRALGPANFLYADGQFLFAHAHQRTQADERIGPPGLYLLRRRCRIAPTADLPTTSDPPRQQALVLCASVPLTEEPWQPIPEGTVLAIAEGRVLARATPQQGILTN